MVTAQANTLGPNDWPSLPLSEWQDTYDTLHMWTEIVGKVRTRLCSPVNHFWHSTLYVSARGLTTNAIPWRDQTFSFTFDFMHDELLLETSEGDGRKIELRPRTVAEFYRLLMDNLNELGIFVKISRKPDEVPNPIPFVEDTVHRSYDSEYAKRLWKILTLITPVFEQFRAEFIGKSSPVHFFWGSFDLAVTRFSGRKAPERPGADPITREAYSHEVISAGWWPGGNGSSIDAPAFYAYAAPEPAGFAQQRIQPAQGHYNDQLHEFLLMYDDVAQSKDPAKMLLSFLHSTYEAGATLGRWDRASLERPQISVV